MMDNDVFDSSATGYDTSVVEVAYGTASKNKRHTHHYTRGNWSRL